jgi:uncharacterized protein (TIGR01777 family)
MRRSFLLSTIRETPMPPTHLLRRVSLPVTAAEAFAWHERPGAFERLTPPWENVQVIERRGTIRNGDRTTIALRIAGVPIRWVAEHFDYQPGAQFCDREVSGPFAVWNHVHRFVPANEHGCYLEDDVAFALPGGWIGKTCGEGPARRVLERLFHYRHRITQDDMNAHARFAAAGQRTVAITGATGLVGSALVPFLTTGGHRVVALSRSAGKPGPAISEPGHWNLATGEIEGPAATPIEAVVHLAGESIASGRWNARRKESIRTSRVAATRRLCEQLAMRPVKPSVLVCASAIGYYGSRGAEQLTEDSAAGDSFLADVCREWEAATAPATEAGIRVVNLRFGVILTPRGGALANMLTPFRLGAGGVIGSGQQYWSWIAIDDVIGAIHQALFTDALRGPVNCTAPNPATNAEFTRGLGRVLRRPTLFPLPAFAARLMLGEMADELLLASARVMPTRLQQSGYHFRFEQLEPALRHLLGAPPLT